MTDQLVHVNRLTLVHRQIVDQNVLQVLNVINTLPVSIKNAKIHAREHVAWELNARSSITIQFAAVQEIISVIHSISVFRSQSSHHETLINVCHHHVDQTVNVMNLMEELFAHVLSEC